MLEGDVHMGEIRENVRKNLGYYLSLKSISQKELAERLGVSQSAVTNWMKGKNSPDIETVAQICKVLEISVIDLFGTDVPSESPQEQLSQKTSNTKKLLLGEKLKYIRELRKLGQKEVADLTGINHKTISNYENNRSEPDVDKLAAFCRVYNVSADFFIPINSNTSTVKNLTARDDKTLERLIKNYDSLNEEGQENLLEYSDFLISSGKYKRNIKNNPLYLGKEA